MALTVPQTSSNSLAPVKKSGAILLNLGLCETDNGHKTLTYGLDLSEEQNRLKTFQNWPNTDMPPSHLAKAGFYYLNHSDAVRCAFCGTEGCQWDRNDDPVKDHYQWSPNCPFLRDNYSGVAPTRPSASTSRVDQAAPISQDVCGNFPSLASSLPDAVRRKIVPHTKPCSYPTFNSFEKRVQSYEHWPKAMKQKPKDLAEAGFYYTGQGDQTLCFNCGGGLKDWVEDDLPWEQHALWFPKCSFLLLSKGHDYVNQIQTMGHDDNTVAVHTTGTTKETVHSLTDPERPEGDNGTLCVICYNNRRSVVFVPCEHMVTCVDCSVSLNGSCPLCRAKFEGTMRVFLA